MKINIKIKENDDSTDINCFLAYKILKFLYYCDSDFNRLYVKVKVCFYDDEYTEWHDLLRADFEGESICYKKKKIVIKNKITKKEYTLNLKKKEYEALKNSYGKEKGGSIICNLIHGLSVYLSKYDTSLMYLKENDSGVYLVNEKHEIYDTYKLTSLFLKYELVTNNHIYFDEKRHIFPF